VKDKDPFLEEFGNRVRLRRLELRLSQRVLAERTKLHVNFIGSIERGQGCCSVYNLVSLARALETYAAALLPGEEERIVRETRLYGCY